MRLHITPEAYADLDSIYTYIAEEQHQPQNATRVLNRIVATLESIQHHPHIGRATEYPFTHELTIATLPFTVVYRIADDTIEIITVFHESQHPDKKIR